MSLIVLTISHINKLKGDDNLALAITVADITVKNSSFGASWGAPFKTDHTRLIGIVEAYNE